MMTDSSNDLPQSEGQCAYCDYFNDKENRAILDRNRRTITLVTQNQEGNARLLVVPKSHKKTVFDLSNREAGELIKATRKAKKDISVAYQGSNISISENDGMQRECSDGHVNFIIDWIDPPKKITEGGGTESVAEEIFSKVREYNKKISFKQAICIKFDEWLTQKTKKLFDSMLGKHMFRSWVNLFLWSLIYTALSFLSFLGIHLSKSNGESSENITIMSFFDPSLLVVLVAGTAVIVSVFNSRKRGLEKEWGKVMGMIVDEVYSACVNFASIALISGILVLHSIRWIEGSFALFLFGYFVLHFSKRVESN